MLNLGLLSCHCVHLHEGGNCPANEAQGNDCSHVVATTIDLTEQTRMHGCWIVTSPETSAILFLNDRC